MRLTPRNTQFYDMFTAAASNALDAALMLTKLVNADYEQRPELARQLKDLEHVADHTTHDIMRALNTSFITPFDREDIAVLASRMDDIVDHIEAAADLTVLYRIETLPSAVRQQAELLEEAARMTVDGMGRLKTLQKLEDYWITINDIENRADAAYRTLLAELFDSELEVVTMIKIKEVVDELESAADAFEDLANVVQSIAAKES
jgi:predicted phosphate transport protein (TIGR00153 family)